ncbi:hypothetical protein [Butyrivibrio sp. ob235]|uniref:hypothetical protein n=1 Tax=Butyrivibrio sp. ob235 TaxID=1761780 RepID=UPI0015879905|nr:hypothetical protein [Butyrivibrio sp. ob235]
MMDNNTAFETLGGVLEGTSAHISRTLMISELESLLQATDFDSSLEDYLKSVVEDNCLLKSTVKTRKVTYTNLKSLYALDPENKLFMLLRVLYEKEPEELPLLAFMCAYCRDFIFRFAVKHIQSVPEGTSMPGMFFQQYLEDQFPKRYSNATRSSMSQNLLASFFRTGHVAGTKMKKVRSQSKPGAAAVCYAATIAYAMGMRGMYLCENEFVKALDCSRESALSLLSDADAKGLIRLRLLGEVMDVQFTFAEGIIS